MVRRVAAESGFWDESTPAELSFLKSGFHRICGVDEAGRGPLAGPVVAAAVIFKDCDTIWKAADSKSLSGKKREILYQEIKEKLECTVAKATPAEIDRLNIRRASLKAMERAVGKLGQRPDLILVDGRDRLDGRIPSRAIIHGDARVAVIAAASIIAKVTRDRLMTAYDRRFPEYGFAKHYGYPTAEHRRLLSMHGPCRIHRKTFRGVRELVSSK